MNTYTISVFREIQYKLNVPAESLAEAMNRVEREGLEAGKLLSSVMTDSQDFDQEGIEEDNAVDFPGEVAQYRGLSLEALLRNLNDPGSRSTKTTQEDD